MKPSKFPSTVADEPSAADEPAVEPSRLCLVCAAVSKADVATCPNCGEASFEDVAAKPPVMTKPSER